MARKEPLTAEALTDIALTIVDAGGPSALTLKEVARRAQVAPPSLYNHVRDLKELRERAVLRVMGQLTDALAAAAIGQARDDAVRALMHAYRDFARRHPQRYLLLEPDPLSSALLREEGRRQLEVVARVLAGYDRDEATQIHDIRLLRSVAHGFASLEAAGGFGLPEDIDETFERLNGMLIAYLNNQSQRSEK